MGKIGGFIDSPRAPQPYRPVEERVRDWRQVMRPWPTESLKTQAARCMDCGIPFCHQGCPLANLIPDWNDLVYHNQWQEAIKRLHATNNFPEFTGTLCPAPCEGACVLDINDNAVTIKAVELAIIDKAWKNGWIQPEILAPTQKTGKKIAIVGSGPAGLAAAQQLVRVGHTVTVFERADRIGGLLRYGIPEFKMEKHYLDRRLQQLEEEGVLFKTGVDVGNTISVERLKDRFDALLLAGGACVARDLPIAGRELNGIHQAMEYLSMQNRLCAGEHRPADFISAAGRHVIIIGGGDTGADCLGTAHRQQARSICQLEILPKPPMARTTDNPWPEWPHTFRTTTAHEEGGERVYSISTQRFIGDDSGNVKALVCVQVQPKYIDGRTRLVEIADSEQILPCDLVLLAMGFVGPERDGILVQLGVALDERGNVRTDPKTGMTNVDGVFSAGDMHRGQSLIVWAIAEGRAAAAGIDQYLMGSTTLPNLL